MHFSPIDKVHREEGSHLLVQVPPCQALPAGQLQQVGQVVSSEPVPLQEQQSAMHAAAQDTVGIILKWQVRLAVRSLASLHQLHSVGKLCTQLADP